MSLNLSMQREIFDPRHARPVTVIGVGSVGSFVVDLFASLGVPDITAIDGDDVASHNIPASRYRRRDLGRFKVDALAEIMKDDLGVTINKSNKYFEPTDRLRGTVVACVDSMSARAMIWRRVCESAPLVDLFVDTRVAERFIRVFAVRPDRPQEVAHYERYLYPNEEAAQQMCGRHGIRPVSVTVAAEAVERVCRFWSEGLTRLHTDGASGGERHIISLTEEAAWPRN